jgi:hypothetical protein
MSYNIRVTHTAPTFKQFTEWGIERAFPTFYINITFYNDKEKEELSFRVKITGYYYCCGSRNFEDINMSLDTYKINNNMSKEQIDELLENDDIKGILEESIKDSMIPNDPIGILEQLWDSTFE